MRVFIIRGAACRTGHNDPCPVMKSCCLCSVKSPWLHRNVCTGATFIWRAPPSFPYLVGPPSPVAPSPRRGFLYPEPPMANPWIIQDGPYWRSRAETLRRMADESETSFGQKPGPGCFGSQRITMSSRSEPNRVCDATSPPTMRLAPASGGFGPARASRDGEDDLSDRQRVRNPDPEKTPRCLLAGHHGRAIPADEQPIWTPARRSRHHVLVETGVSVAHPRAG